MWGLFLLASPADAAHPMLDPKVNEARNLLALGGTAAARGILTPMVEEHPKSGSLVLLLAATWFAEGECERGLELVLPWRDKNVWTARTSQTVASCWGRRGEAGEALYWMEESNLLTKRETPGLWSGMAYYQWWAGDYASSAASLERADELEMDASGTRLLRAQIAVEEGYHAQALYWLDTLAEDEDFRRPAMAVRAELEVDSGSLRAARQLLYLNVSAQWTAAAAALLGETWRRASDPEAALEYLERPRVRDYMQPIRVVKVRVLADLGRFDEAQALLAVARGFDALDPDVVASAWYLARAKGDEAEAERLARLHARLQSNPHRALRALSPTESP